MAIPAALAASLCLATAPADAQSASPQGREAHLDAGNFRFGSDARNALQTLWRTSSAANEERVACLGGHRHGTVTFITRVEKLTGLLADSSNASAAASIQQCRPPEWLGTVHTHIVQFGGQPYVTFSAPDRGVIREWHKLWKVDGVFCVIYDDRHAYCEAGDDSSGETSYSGEPELRAAR